jgi:hypothetical protein
MATYTTNGGIKKIATGDESGTWGTSTNTNFDIIDRLTNGVVSITLTGATETVTTSDGTISDGMSKVLVFGGTPGVAVTVTIAPNDAQKVYFIKNDSGQTVTISQGSGSTVDILDGSSSIVYCDGAGAGAAVVEITAGSSATNTIDVTSFTATAAQTTFAVTYTVGSIAVYQNGVLLRDTTDYTATNGTSVVLAAGATSGDAIDVVAYATFTVTDTYTKAQSDARYAQSANNLSDLSSAATALTNLGVTATATELNYNDITTLGIVEASKVVTADASGNVTVPDDEELKFGTSGDLQITHNSANNNSIIREVGSGLLSIQTNGSAVTFYDSANAVQMAAFNTGGSCDLAFQGTTRFATTSTGADVTGELIADSYNETYAAVTSSSNATTVDCEAGNAFSHTLTENTTFTFSNPPASGTSYSFTLKIVQDASASGYTVTWPTSVDWPEATAPTLTATASAVDYFVFITHDGGTTWYGFTAGQALG